METWIRRDTQYDGKIVRLYTGEVQLDDGTTAFREVVEHNGGVGIVPFLGDSVVFVRQYRIAVEEYTLEIPAGKLEGDESPELRGRVELEEETGYRAGRVESCGYFYPSPGCFSEKLYIYLAFDLEKGEQNLEMDEHIERVEISLDEVRGRLARHEFTDGKTIIGLYALLSRIDT
ncbi:MAG: NUDIX hydrolase [Candidatus Hydrogenedentes bacterium]|nr:NUDIX hydrolase [Candidatus Hydrogenedentota bacterium]